jgi:putative ABC transport system ATP-binding protein
MPSLEIRDLTIEYPSGGYPVRPLDNFNLTAPPGSLVLLLGPSGCGKTSLLSCLGGILSPKHGTIRFGDVDVGSLDGDRLTEYRRRSVGIIFQAFNLVPSLTALENVLVPLRAAGVGRSDARAKAVAGLEAVGLGERLSHRPGALSGGQQQRVAIARALALDPPLVLADEPTAHLDYVQVEDVLRVLRELVAANRVVIVATHDDRLLPLADKVVEMVPAVASSSRPPQVVELEAGEVLFRQHSWGDLVYVLDSGTIDIVTERADGTEERKAVVQPGQFFGEIAPVFGLPRSATARARTPAVVVGYTVRDFRDLVEAATGAKRKASTKKAAQKRAKKQPTGKRPAKKATAKNTTAKRAAASKRSAP